jgi:heme/copper-type cytochrome/quinol oxidase subunit 2
MPICVFVGHEKVEVIIIIITVIIIIIITIIIWDIYNLLTLPHKLRVLKSRGGIL